CLDATPRGFLGRQPGAHKVPRAYLGPLPALGITILVVVWRADGLPQHFENDLSDSFVLQGENRIKLAGQLQEATYRRLRDAVLLCSVQDGVETRFALLPTPSGLCGGLGRGPAQLLQP